MATNTRFIAPNLTSDATYRAACSEICAGLAAVGLVQTADTGQATWVSETKPVGANTFSHYQIYRFDDALQATNPIFIKVEFGTGSTASNLGLRFSFSSSTDGAGSLNGTFISNTQTVSMARNRTDAIPCYFSSDTGRLQMALFVSNSYSAFAVVVSLSRTVDSNGDPTADGATLVVINEGSKTQQFVSNASGAGKNPSSTTQSNLMSYCPAFDHPGVGTWGNKVGFFPILQNRGYADYFDKGLLCYPRAIFPVSEHIITLTLYGASHTYLSVANTLSTLFCPNGSSTWMGLLIRYE